MVRLHYSEQFAQRVFNGATTKDAYMKACKWYASNIIARDELHEIQCEFVKGINQVTLKLFAVLPEAEVLASHCQCCKEMHHSFFINEDTACNRCSAMAYQRRLKQKIAIKVGYYKSLVSKLGGDE